MNAAAAPSAPQPPAGPPKRPPSLRRELLAIAFLYAILSVLPLLIGLAMAPSSPP